MAGPDRRVDCVLCLEGLDRALSPRKSRRWLHFGSRAFDRFDRLKQTPLGHAALVMEWWTAFWGPNRSRQITEQGPCMHASISETAQRCMPTLGRSSLNAATARNDEEAAEGHIKGLRCPNKPQAVHFAAVGRLSPPFSHNKLHIVITTPELGRRFFGRLESIDFQGVPNHHAVACRGCGTRYSTYIHTRCLYGCARSIKNRLTGPDRSLH